MVITLHDRTQCNSLIQDHSRKCRKLARPGEKYCTTHVFAPIKADNSSSEDSEWVESEESEDEAIFTDEEIDEIASDRSAFERSHIALGGGRNHEVADGRRPVRLSIERNVKDNRRDADSKKVPKDAVIRGKTTRRSMTPTTTPAKKSTGNEDKLVQLMMENIQRAADDLHEAIKLRTEHVSSGDKKLERLVQHMSSIGL
ncbi:hypothetical protein IWX49DRAFT_640991 [Phyllosticta citricarpa]|uniref:Uncharacterized protein n=2 Tax=Phyllosticta TaxID=121621 RepID=A0ABR1LC32_9PEZI